MLGISSLADPSCRISGTRHGLFQGQCPALRPGGTISVAVQPCPGDRDPVLVVSQVRREEGASERLECRAASSKQTCRISQVPRRCSHRGQTDHTFCGAPSVA